MMVCMAWPGMLGPLDDVHRPVFGELPHGLGVVGKEGWRGAEQPLVPGQRRGVVADWYPCEQVDGHAAMLVRTAHLAGDTVVAGRHGFGGDGPAGW